MFGREQLAELQPRSHRVAHIHAHPRHRAHAADGDFIADPRSRTDELVIEAIVCTARGLGKRTIAEFVGDDATIALLSALGVDFGQGYHIDRPFPVAELRS